MIDTTDWINAWLIMTVVLFTTHHWIGASVSLVFAALHAWVKRTNRKWSD
jgi:hypothetical protein